MQVQQLRTSVLSRLKPKSVSGCPVNGAGFVSLVQTYITAINGGAVPSLADAWTSAVQTQCSQVCVLFGGRGCPPVRSSTC